MDADPSPSSDGSTGDAASDRAPAAGPTAPSAAAGAAAQASGGTPAALGDGAPGAEPTTPLSPRAVELWRLPWLGALAAVLLLTITVAAGGQVPGLPAALSWVGVVLLWILAGAGIVLVPPLRHRRWRYAVRGDEIDLMRGVWARRRTVVPVARIQHVDVERTPVSDTFGLAELHVHTAAGTVTIPALDASVAAAIRDHVADLAKVPDDL